MNFDRAFKILGLLLPLLAFIAIFYSEHKSALADIIDLKSNHLALYERLEKISEKLNQIDGKLTIIIKGLK